MKKNWYAVYIKTNCEKKVAALLQKKEIENYYPVGAFNFQDSNKRVYKSLFPSMIFVHVTEAKIEDVKKISNVTSFAYWLNKPVVIKNDEIAGMQYFTSEFSNINLEKTTIEPSELGNYKREPHTGINGKLFSVKNTLIRLLLPSLGYMMVAEVEKSNASLFNNNLKRSNLVS